MVNNSITPNLCISICCMFQMVFKIAGWWAYIKPGKLDCCSLSSSVWMEREPKQVLETEGENLRCGTEQEQRVDVLHEKVFCLLFQ